MNGLPLHRLNLLIFCLLFLFSGCTSTEIQELQYSVNRLESQVERFQHVAAKDTAETASSLGEMNQSLQSAFRDIRYKQSNMETLVDNLSERLSQVEGNLQSLQTKTNRLDKFSTSSANETLALKESQQKIQNQILQQLNKIEKENTALRDSLASLKTNQTALTQRLDTMESNNREIYQKILTELGASDAAASYSGEVHTVQSGDTLSKIAAKYGVSQKKIQELNGITNPSKINIGQDIRIPQ